MTPPGRRGPKVGPVPEVGLGPKVGLVLGAGGVAGGAFHAGVLAALEEAAGWEPRLAAIVVGTSAGSVTGASLRAGLAAADLLARAEGRPMSAAGARLMAEVGPPPAPPALRSSGRARPAAVIAARLARAAVRPLEARPLAVLAALLPAGALGTDVISAAIAGLALGSWPADPLWLCAVRERDGRLVVFGRDVVSGYGAVSGGGGPVSADDAASGGGLQPPLPDAVAASCAVPGLFRPVSIGGDLFVDGGAHSPTNADVLAGVDLDLVVVSSPMSLAARGPRLAIDQPARRWSRLLLDAETARLRRRGTHVIAFQPTTEDLAVIGPSLMESGSPRRGGTPGP
jgi:NTE family protein